MNSFEYDESKDPIVAWLGKQASLNRIIRIVNCKLKSSIKTAYDSGRCSKLCFSVPRVTYKDDEEIVTYEL